MRLRIVQLPREQTLFLFDKVSAEQEEDMIEVDLAQTMSKNMLGVNVLIFAGDVELEL